MESLKQRNNDVNGEAFTSNLEDASLSIPIMPQDESIDEHLTKQSKKADHPEWFEGNMPNGADAVANYETKEEYFIKRLWRRRKKYWKKFHQKLENEGNKMLSLLIKNFIEEF